MIYRSSSLEAYLDAATEVHSALASEAYVHGVVEGIALRERVTAKSKIKEYAKDNEKVSTLLTQLNRSNHLKIMSDLIWIQAKE